MADSTSEIPIPIRVQENATEPTSTGQKIDPWNVQGEIGADGVAKAINYNTLIEEFGTKKILAEDLERFEKVTGHTVPFEFTKWLQEVFDVPLVIMMTDDEKFIFSEKRTIEEVMSYTAGNAKDIIAVGFDPKKTSCIGKIHFGAVQGATSFANSFPHIFGDDDSKTSQIPAMIPCAIDQDPYFRLTRDVAARLHYAKPALIHARFLDALQGPGSKMSSSVDTSAIFMYDEPNKIKNKINKYAFSGGQDTMEEQREKGGDTEKDVAYQYLTFFLEDDEELEKIGNDYRTGKMLTGELKAKCISELQVYVKGFQERRAQVTDEVVADFFSAKKLEWKGNPNPTVVAKEGGEAGASAEGDGKLSKSQLKKIEKEKIFAQRKAEKEAAKTAKAGGS
ncbi:putative Tryptophanyl-tRNA synthetase, cytoplasmic [Glarea lozoyensis 74030]|uniref:Tryptophan--tRNA ligase, cytoplasmic n=1 Tax=Glarea lozoyensis (strain ATCC 74030 / MF5533) TaxID=1104152 RepID=H0ESH0_GLAL7|nr:putative Tryptophanyl-tRNA synthetase, cytoplasmic [Glarea lozoyensis 74030]